MRESKKGFTLIEVSLFLAITGLLFLGVTVGVQSSIYWQRYNDATQSFAEFLRSVYSQVSNVQSFGGGVSNEAIYGKIVAFGTDAADDKVYVYTLIGKADTDAGGSSTSGGTIELLDDLGASVSARASVGGAIELRGAMETYAPKWGSLIENTNGNRTEGTLLIARHPRSGVIHTYYVNTKFDKNTLKKLGHGGLGFGDDKMVQVDFCMDVNRENMRRADIRIVADARSASGVEVVGTDGGEYACGE